MTRFQSYLEEIDKIIPLESPNVALLDTVDHFYFYNYLTPMTTETLNSTIDKKKTLHFKSNSDTQNSLILDDIAYIEYISKGRFLLKYNGDNICIVEFTVATDKKIIEILQHTKTAIFVKVLTVDLIFYALGRSKEKYDLFVCKWQTKQFCKLRWPSQMLPKRVEYLCQNKLALLSTKGVLIIYDLVNFSGSKVIVSQQNLIQNIVVGPREAPKIHCFSSSLDEYTCYDHNGVRLSVSSLAVDEDEENCKVEVLAESVFLFWNTRVLKLYEYKKDRFELLKKIHPDTVFLYIGTLDETSCTRFHKIKSTEDQKLLIIIRFYMTTDINPETRILDHQDAFISLNWKEMLEEKDSGYGVTSSVSNLNSKHIMCIENAKKKQVVAMDTFEDVWLCVVTSDSDFILYEMKSLQVVEQKQVPFEEILSIKIVSKQRIVVHYRKTSFETAYDVITLPSLSFTPIVTNFMNEKGWRLTNISVFLANGCAVAGITRNTLILDTLPSFSGSMKATSNFGINQGLVQDTIQSTLQNQDLDELMEDEDEKQIYNIENEVVSEEDSKCDSIFDEEMCESGHNKGYNPNRVKHKNDYISTNPLIVLRLTGPKIKSSFYPELNTVEYKQIFKLQAEWVIATKQKSHPHISKIINIQMKKEIREIAFNGDIIDIVGLHEEKAAVLMEIYDQATNIAIFNWKQGFIYFMIDCINAPFLIGGVHNHLVWVDTNESQDNLMDIKAVNLLNCRNPGDSDTLEQELNAAFVKGTSLLEGVSLKKNAICFERDNRRIFFQDASGSTDFITCYETVSISFEFFKILHTANKHLKYNSRALCDIYHFIFPKTRNENFHSQVLTSLF